MTPFRQLLSILLAWCLAAATLPEAYAFQNPPPYPPAQAAPPSYPQPQAAPPPNAPPPVPVQGAQPSEAELERLVAPIGLYPDSLVAQILAASTFPEEIVEADRWLNDHRNLQGQQLADAVNQQPWDPSVKALTAFPSVLSNMDKNLSWTSSLGDAYVNDQPGVMNAIQVMRQRAQAAGNLRSTPQQSVVTSGPNIVIQPVNPQVVYVPQFDPWLVYGAPLAPWPGWYWYPGLYITGPGLVFGAGFGLGFFAGFGWGWPHWGFDWGRRTVIFNHRNYFAHSNTFVNRNQFVRNRGFYNNRFQAPRGREGFRPGFAGPRGAEPRFQGGSRAGEASRSAGPRFQAQRPGAFSGFNRGGAARGFSERGFESFGGSRGGAFHGGGVRGGGTRGGGGRR